MRQEPIAITGLGVTSTLGTSPDALADALEAGRSGIRTWRDMDPRIYSKFGGDLSDLDLQALVREAGGDRAEHAASVLRLAPPATLHAAHAALQATAGLDCAPERLGLLVGCHNAHVQGFQDNAAILADEPDFLEPLFGLWGFDTDIASALAEVLDARGPSFTVGGACASSNLALCAAADLIRSGRADAVVVGGVATQASSLSLQAWSHLEALAIHSFQDEPEAASRPFDRRREGFVPSEGSGMVVLERSEHARARGATPLAWLLGTGATSSATRHTRPDQDGQVRAMRAALDEAGIDGDEVDFVSAHATSTPQGDRVEAWSIVEALGREDLPINAPKSMLGHCLQGAAAVELVATVQQVRRQRIHPTRNLEEPDPELAHLDLVADGPRDHRIRVALSNSFGFGGLNSCIAVGAA